MRDASTHDWAVLALGEEASKVARQTAGEQALVWGYASIARQCLRHTPVSDGDVEQAIAVVEDFIMPLARPWPRPVVASTLACISPPLRLLLPHLGSGVAEVTGWRLYHTDAVETLFNRFADIAMGGPARGLDLSAYAVSSLIVVRECLHHWGMQTLALPAD